HQRIAHVLEEQFPEIAEAQPELLAHHYTEAGLIEQSVAYWYKAGQKASERSAHAEAVNHLTKGLVLLQTLPETPERVQRELSLHITMGASLMATKGYAAQEVEHAYTRARELCQQVGETPQLFSVLRGLWAYYLTRIELHLPVELGAQILRLAQSVQSQSLLIRAHFALGQTFFHLGEFSAARTHVEDGMTLFDPQRRSGRAMPDPGLGCFCYAAWTLWSLGYPDQGLTRIDEAVTLGQQIAHPFSLGYALNWAAMCHQFRREVHATQERAEAVIRLAMDQGFPLWMAFGAILRGWALAHQGQTKEEIEQMHWGIRAWRATGAELLRPYFLALLAEAYGTRGQPEAGLTALTEALTLADTAGERWYESECYRLKGALLLQQNSDNQAEAESCFSQAISIAQRQQAKSWELRAATSLARLWQQQGKRQEAQDLLAPVYNWFTEG